jgi:RES domain
MGVIGSILEVASEKTFRIVPSRFPPIELFERVTDPADLDAVYQIETMTNPRIRDEVGDLTLVPREDRVSGPGASPIMAAFTHLNPDGSRFTAGHYGVYYAAGDIGTAIEETRHQRTRFMLATDEPAAELDMRVYVARLSARLHDIRCLQAEYPNLYHPTDYSGSQIFANGLRSAGADGIAYTSLRRPDGECFAVFRPRLLSNCRQERHLCYVWNGASISTVYEKRELVS